MAGFKYGVDSCCGLQWHAESAPHSCAKGKLISTLSAPTALQSQVLMWLLLWQLVNMTMALPAHIERNLELWCALICNGMRAAGLKYIAQLAEEAAAHPHSQGFCACFRPPMAGSQGLPVNVQSCPCRGNPGSPARFVFQRPRWIEWPAEATRFGSPSLRWHGEHFSS